jgi:hypothetical protein
VKTLNELENELRLMRRETADYSFDPEHDPHELLRRKGECAHLAGVIEELRKST